MNERFPSLQRAAWVLTLAGLSLAVPLRADLDAKLAVAAHALAADPARTQQPIALGALSSSDGQGYADGERSLLEALRQALTEAPGVTLRGEGAKVQGADPVLDGSYQVQGQGVLLTLHLHPASGGADAWARSVWIPDAELPAAAEEAAPNAAAPAASAAATVASVAPTAADPEPLAAEAPAPDDGEALRVPTLPDSETHYRRRRAGGPREPFIWDLSAGYQAYFPLNSNFQSVAGTRLDGLSLGLSMKDIFLADLSTWHAGVNGPGTLTALDYVGLDLAVVAPWHLGPLTLYVGPGGRFGTIELSDSSLTDGSVGFGNNGLVAVGGIKARIGSLGLDARYTYDLASSYTGYHTVRLGAFYEFGR